jgi:hypothetical protein
MSRSNLWPFGLGRDVEAMIVRHGRGEGVGLPIFDVEREIPSILRCSRRGLVTVVFNDPRRVAGRDILRSLQDWLGRAVSWKTVVGGLL